MPRPKTRDHHLRERMLRNSMAMLETEGPSALTARRVATSSESSTAALYELFGDKSGLVAEIFYEGFRGLAGRLLALPETADSRADVRASQEATRRFALEAPMLHEVMYARPFAEFEPAAADTKSAQTIYSHHVGRVARFLGRPKNHAMTIDAAQALIAANRGLISSELAGILGSSNKTVERRRSLTFDSLLDGLEGRQQ